MPTLSLRHATNPPRGEPDKAMSLLQAGPEDTDAILELVSESVEHGILLFRSRESVEIRVGDYWILRSHGEVAGCVAMHFYESGRVAELACLCVNRSFMNRGFGQSLVEKVILEAEMAGVHRLISATKNAGRFLERFGGFLPGTPCDLPGTRRAIWKQHGCHSTILVRNFMGPA